MFLRPFEGPALKLERARHHYAEMYETIIDYQKRANPVFVKSDRKQNPWQIEISENVPPLVGIQIGDIAHSLRSALDVILCDIAHIRSVGVSDMCYPFASSADRFSEMMSEPPRKQPFKKLGADVIEIISESEPYINGNRLLRGLHDLNNQDKHRMAIPNVTFISCTTDTGHGMSFFTPKDKWHILRQVITISYDDMLGIRRGIGELPSNSLDLVGYNIGEPLLFNEEYASHPSDVIRFNQTPMIVCFPAGFVLQGNVITIMGELIDYIDQLIFKLATAAQAPLASDAK